MSKPKKPKKPRADRDRLWMYAQEARKAWAVKPGHSSVRGSLRVPLHLASLFEGQSSEERGAAWADGCTVREQIALLYRLLSHLSDGQNISHSSGDPVTVLVGQDSFKAPTQIEALMSAIAYYLPPEPVLEPPDQNPAY